MTNRFVYVELNTTDVSPSKAFYSKLFDWKLEDVTAWEWTTPLSKTATLPSAA
jgi:predicted enzyme related to lactoylglutathione lyase